MTKTKLQTLENFVKGFIESRPGGKPVDDIIEIGSDIQLKFALRLAPYCKTFSSVNFPQDHAMMQGWYEMHQKMGGVDNMSLLSGDATKLSDILPHTDLILARNVLIDGNNGEDTTLMMKYRRGEVKCNDKLWAELIAKFDPAQERAYKEFLKVAHPGAIITLEHKDKEKDTLNFFKKLGISSRNITSTPVLYDSDAEATEENSWNAYTIMNHK